MIFHGALPPGDVPDQLDKHLGVSFSSLGIFLGEWLRFAPFALRKVR
jgi:hypothetical protein